ncbi:hypothetical protein [Kitasatospora sp. NPDC091207]|uniref:hypothetical protein n=1 Tax=Kitasatospora sp. NPDC091207 TaxID=3364083 RepID=UPI0037F2768A
MAKAIHLHDRDIPKAYTAYPRNGIRDNPTPCRPEALATFFGVEPAYFFGDEVAQEAHSALSALVALREAGIRLGAWAVFRDAGITKIAARADGLSPGGPRAAAIGQVDPALARHLLARTDRTSWPAPTAPRATRHAPRARNRRPRCRRP